MSLPMRRTPGSPLVIAPRDPLGYTVSDHLPSGPWYTREYPDRKPKLLTRVRPAYAPEYEQ